MGGAVTSAPFCYSRASRVRDELLRKHSHRVGVVHTFGFAAAAPDGDGSGARAEVPDFRQLLWFGFGGLSI